MQCKDVPTLSILEFLIENKGIKCGWFDCSEKDVKTAMPPKTPDKIVLAKMGKLIRKGYVDGCDCGCRGDFEITKKGEEYKNALKRKTTTCI